MKKIIIVSFLVWMTFGIFFYFQMNKIFTEQEFSKAHLLAETLAAKNAPFLQTGLEPLLSTQEILQWPGVREAWIENDQGRTLTPRQKISNASHWLRIEKSMERGKAILLYQPQDFPSLGFGLAWLLPILFGVPFLIWRRRSKPNPISIPNSYPWLVPLAKLLGKKFYLFDSQGNILAFAQPTGPFDPSTELRAGFAQGRHILDLFLNPEESQHILKTMEGLEENERVGSWREENGENCFLFIDG